MAKYTQKAETAEDVASNVEIAEQTKAGAEADYVGTQAKRQKQQVGGPPPPQQVATPVAVQPNEPYPTGNAPILTYEYINGLPTAEGD
jgi:hypothetical protein